MWWIKVFLKYRVIILAIMEEQHSSEDTEVTVQQGWLTFCGL